MAEVPKEVYEEEMGACSVVSKIVGSHGNIRSKYLSLNAVVFVTALVCPITQSAHGQEFTLQQALSAPFASDLVPGPKPGTVAWMENQQGRRNLWCATRDESGKLTSKRLTQYNDDDGKQMDDIAWTPDAKYILYVRGGDAEFPARPYPNPALATEGVSQDIWLVSSSGGEPRKLGEGHSPAISSKSGQIAFLSHGQAWSVGVAPDAGKAKPMFHARGEISSLTWAPDGHALAFTSDRGDHGFIGIYDIESKSLRYLEPSTADDSQPAWSPDSRRVAFIREPGQPEEHPSTEELQLPGPSM